MSKFIVKTTNQTALILSNHYSNLESSLEALPLYEFGRHLVIRNDPLSSQHLLVQQKNLQGPFLRLEKKDVALANQNRLELYFLLATIFEKINTA